MRDRLAIALRGALRGRDQAATAALRSALAAIANAEAIEPDSRPAGQPVVASEHLAGTAAGLGAAEAPRKVVTEADAAAIVRAEIEERQLAARQYEQSGHDARAERLRTEIEVLSAVLGSA
jgi:uncharacterized protein YqeY